MGLLSRSHLQKMLENGVITINEARKIECFDDISIPSHSHTISISANNINSHTHGVDLYGEMIGMAALKKPIKIVCLYCSRPNAREHDLCQSCGAPLSAT